MWAVHIWEQQLRGVLEAIGIKEVDVKKAKPLQYEKRIVIQIAIDENRTPNTILIDQPTLFLNEIQQENTLNGNRIRPSVNYVPSTTRHGTIYSRKYQLVQNMLSVR